MKISEPGPLALYGPFSPLAQMSQKQQHAERYLAAANEAAHAASHLYITFLLLGTYIGVIIASTTDEQLLRVSPVTLPILDVKLPIRGFYTFVPWLFLLLHFNLLLHFHLLARKLHAFDKSAAEHEDAENLALRERLANISFVHMLVGRQHDPFLSRLLAFMVWITVVALPLSLLLWAQIAFLPFHDPAITWGQRIAVFLDAGLLLLFWGRIISSQGAISWWMQRFDQIRAWAVWGWCWFWARIRKFVRWLPWNLVRLNRPARSGPSGALFVLAVTIGASVTSLLIATVPDEPWEMCMLNWLPKQWIVQCEEGGFRLQRQCFSITAALFERRNAVFHRNLDLREKVLTLNELSAEDVTWLRTREGGEPRKTLNRALGMDLQDRDLRWLGLFGQIFLFDKWIDLPLG